MNAESDFSVATSNSTWQSDELLIPFTSQKGIVQIVQTPTPGGFETSGAWYARTDHGYEAVKSSGPPVIDQSAEFGFQRVESILAIPAYSKLHIVDLNGYQKQTNQLSGTDKQDTKPSDRARMAQPDTTLGEEPRQTTTPARETTNGERVNAEEPESESTGDRETIVRAKRGGNERGSSVENGERAGTVTPENNRLESLEKNTIGDAPDRSDPSEPPSFNALPSGWQPPPLSPFDLEEINDAKIALTPDPVWRDQISRAMNGSSDPADKDAFMDAYSLVSGYGDVVDIVRLVITAVKDPSKISGGMVAAAVLPYTLGQIRVINALGRIGSELGPFPTWLEKTDKGRRTWRRKKRKNSKPRKRKTKLSEELKQYLREQRKEDIKRIKEKQKIWIRARVEEELSKEGRSVDLIRERIKGQINEAGHKITYMNKLLEKYLKELGR